MDEFSDVSYIPGTSNPLQSFDLYVPMPAQERSPMIAFVHGGAWRGGDKAAHQDLARRLAAASNCPVLVPNYRLTPPVETQENQFRHPGHAEDILRFLEFLASGEIPQIKFNPRGRGLYLLGHSAGAHILSSIFLDSSAVTPTLTPSPAVLQATRGIAMTEGIYDLDVLLARFPSYREWFIAAAFGDRESYADASTTRFGVRREADLRWLVIHSKGDTLVDQPQSDAIYAHLRALYGGGAAADARVARNVDQFDVEHDDVHETALYVDVIRAFVAEGSK
ncbi:Alpha/Beta hydrolase protein [Mycena sanguinolenta]|nr:Alpha/Beta hydrolase protein [Mycena sanguinolenta]